MAVLIFERERSQLLNGYMIILNHHVRSYAILNSIERTLNFLDGLFYFQPATINKQKHRPSFDFTLARLVTTIRQSVVQINQLQFTF